MVTRFASCSSIYFVFFVVLLGVGSSSCARAQAAAAGPPLEVPEPPPRVIATFEEPVTSAPPVTEAPVATPAPAPTAARPPARRATGAADEPTPAPIPVQPEPPRELRSAASGRDGAAERAVRDTLARAARDLGRVDYGRLSREGRAQYEQSKRFTQQAEDALKDRNFIFAATLADKAATLAAELLGR